MTHQSIPTYCALCISRCGCLATVEDGRLLRIEADPEHPTGKAICIKARAAPELVTHPERLRTPLRRTRPKGDADPGWQPIGWDEALAFAADRLQAAGPAATAFAVTTPSGTAIADSFGWIHRLAHAFGSPNLVFATENCNWHRDFTPALSWGRSLGTPDFNAAQTIVLWGVNPAATWLAQAERIRRAQQRGARLIVIDPQQSGLGLRADLWLGLRPGSDGALALGLIRLLLKNGGSDAEFLREHSDAFDPIPGGGDTRETVLSHLAATAESWTEAHVAETTGISPEQLHQAAEWLGAGQVALATWTGTCQQEQATDTTRAINLLYALTGSLGKPGGNRWFPKPKINDIAGFELVDAATRAQTLGIGERPLGPPGRGWITTRDLFAAIVTAQPYPIRALVAFGGNFLVSKPETRHAEAALARLDFFVQTELFDTPTARWADLLLPAASCWEREGLQAGFMVDAVAEAHLQLRPALVGPPGEARSDTDIVFALASALGLDDHFFGGSAEAGLAHVLAPSGIDADALRRQPRGVTAPRLSEEPPPPRVTFRSATLAASGGHALPQISTPQRHDEFPWALTCGKVVAYCHSQFRQIASLRRHAPAPAALIAADIAAALALADGEPIVIETQAGRMECTAQLGKRLAPGTIWAQYGWWSPTSAASYNAAMDGEAFDTVSGSNALRGVPCRVRRAGAPGSSGETI